MRGLLIRVGIDSSCGNWNPPVDLATGEFAYVPIPESQPVHPGLETPYADILPAVARFNMAVPRSCLVGVAHLDPDFSMLTYGDQGGRARRIRETFTGAPEGFVAFYASLRDIESRQLINALIGVYHVVEVVADASTVPKERWGENAHTRRVANAGDVIIRARPGISGRLERCIVIGRYRDRAHRVDRDILEAWGGLAVRDGYIQRSARLPAFLNPAKFLEWLASHSPRYLAGTNPS